jgi:hypothetical protein
MYAMEYTYTPYAYTRYVDGACCAVVLYCVMAALSLPGLPTLSSYAHENIVATCPSWPTDIDSQFIDYKMTQLLRACVAGEWMVITGRHVHDGTQVRLS